MGMIDVQKHYETFYSIYVCKMAKDLATKVLDPAKTPPDVLDNFHVLKEIMTPEHHAFAGMDIDTVHKNYLIIDHIVTDIFKRLPPFLKPEYRNWWHGLYRCLSNYHKGQVEEHINDVKKNGTGQMYNASASAGGTNQPVLQLDERMAPESRTKLKNFLIAIHKLPPVESY